MIGEEDVVLAGFSVVVADAAQANRAVLVGLQAGELDDLVTSKALVGCDLLAFDDAVLSIPLQPDDGEHAFLCQLVIPSVIGIATVKDHDAASGKASTRPASMSVVLPSVRLTNCGR